MTIMVTQTLRKAAQHDPCYFFLGRALFYIDSSLPDRSERPDFFELEIERPSVAQEGANRKDIHRKSASETCPTCMQCHVNAICDINQ